TFMPMHELGLMGMNRRIALYDPQFTDLNVLATIGSYIMAVSTIPFLINAAWSWRYGPKAPANPWRALTLEWQTLSPPHIENFEALPVLKTGPYDYGLGYTAEEDPAELYEHGVPAPAAT
ncbi:MAG: cytochrome c oxidase subunit I, partial [Phormidesmis sp.]